MKNKCLFLIGLLACMMAGCSTETIEYYNPVQEGSETEKPKPEPIEYFKFNTATDVTDLVVKETRGVYSFETTGGDPNIRLEPLAEANNADSVVLTFDYIAPQGVSELEIFYSIFNSATGSFGVIGGRSEIVGDLPATDSWQNISFNLYKKIKEFGWGITGDFLRLDFGREAGVDFQIKNMYLRSMTDEEKNEINKKPVSVMDFTIDVDRSKVNGVDFLSTEGGEYSMKTTNADPYIYTNTLSAECSDEAVVLSFDYIAPKGVTLFQLLISPEAPDRFTNLPDIAPSNEWKTYSVNLKDVFNTPQYAGWGNKGDFIRLDLGSTPGVEIKIRNIRLSSSQE